MPDYSKDVSIDLDLDDNNGCYSPDGTSIAYGYTAKMPPFSTSGSNDAYTINAK